MADTINTPPDSPLSNEKLSYEFGKLAQKAKKNSIIIITSAVVVLIIAGLLLFTTGNSSKQIKALKKENKELQKSLMQLKKDYSADSIDRINIIIEQEEQRQERQNLLSQIRSTNQQLTKFKTQYEKVNDYKNIPATDSLVRIFSKRFDY